MSINYIILDNKETLLEIMSWIPDEASSFIAIDTEFTRYDTYWPMLEIVQVALENRPIILVDCQKQEIAQEFLNTIFLSPALKIFHSARQDCEAFLKYIGKLPTPLFDTQIAAAFLGFGMNIGLDELVEHLLGEFIDKEYQVSNWKERPLNSQQLLYAAYDAYYLLKLYPILIQELKAQDRLNWITEFFNHLTDFNRYEVDVENAWKRLKFHVKENTQLYFLKHFSALREKLAFEHNYNRARVICDESLINLCQISALDHEGHQASLFIETYISTMFAKEFLNTYLQAKDDYKPSMLFELRQEIKAQKQVIKSDLKKYYQELTQFANQEANRLSIPVSYFLPSKMAHHFFKFPSCDHPLYSGWRGAFLKDILDILMIEINNKNLKQDNKPF